MYVCSFYFVLLLVFYTIYMRIHAIFIAINFIFGPHILYVKSTGVHNVLS